MLAVRRLELGLVEADARLVRVRPDAVERDLDRAGLPGGPLRDERGKAAPEALGCARVGRSCHHRLRRSAATATASRRGTRSASAAYASAPARGRGVAVDRQAVARRLGQTDAARDDRRVHEPAEVAARLGVDLGGQVGPAVGHGQDDAVDGEARIEVVTDEIDGGEQLGESLECVVLALERDEDRCRRRSGH